MKMVHLINVFWDSVNNRLISISQFGQVAEIASGAGATPTLDEVLADGNTGTLVIGDLEAKLFINPDIGLVGISLKDTANDFESTILMKQDEGHISLELTCGENNGDDFAFMYLKFQETEQDSGIFEPYIKLNCTSHTLGDESTEILIEPDAATLNGAPIATVKAMDNFADDAEAEIGGVMLGELYHTSGAVKIRLA